MRDRFFRAAALVLGLLAIPALVFDLPQLLKAWPPAGILPERCGALIFFIGIFVRHGLGLDDRSRRGKTVEKPPASAARWWISEAVYRVGMLGIGALALLYFASGMAILAGPDARPSVDAWDVGLATLRITWGASVFTDALRQAVRGRRPDLIPGDFA